MCLLAINIFMVAIFLSPVIVHAAGAENDYLEASRMYNQGDFEGAATLFESIAAHHVVSGDLYYNIGNAYFKKDDVGKSILWYERALKLIPGDPDLLFNHNFVSGLVVDKAEIKSNPLMDVLFFWKKKIATRTISFFAVSLFVLFILSSAIRSIKPVRWLKYPERIILGFSLIFIISAFNDYYRDRFEKTAVVISDTVPVRSGLSQDTTELFRLHEGTKVNVDEELRGYVKIRFSVDKIGWVEKKDIEMI
jgi:tetratricopeptide (TPR) repeat protein